jgi:hypothetical protein
MLRIRRIKGPKEDSAEGNAEVNKRIEKGLTRGKGIYDFLFYIFDLIADFGLRIRN